MNRKPWAEICLVILGSVLYFMANLQRVAVLGAMFDTLTHDLQTTAQACRLGFLPQQYILSSNFGQKLQICGHFCY